MLKLCHREIPAQNLLGNRWFPSAGSRLQRFTFPLRLMRLMNRGRASSVASVPEPGRLSRMKSLVRPIQHGPGGGLGRDYGGHAGCAGQGSRPCSLAPPPRQRAVRPFLPVNVLLGRAASLCTAGGGSRRPGLSLTGHCGARCLAGILRRRFLCKLALKAGAPWGIPRMTVLGTAVAAVEGALLMHFVMLMAYFLSPWGQGE